MPKQQPQTEVEPTLDDVDAPTKRFDLKKIAFAAAAAVLIPLAAVGTRTLFAGYKLKVDDNIVIEDPTES